MSSMGPAWLERAVFYQVYPQSFYDSNGDGIGDINGITEKLDYILSLGCDAIWLNPCFESPFRDAGYDISDYYKVAKRYGTNTDLKRLFREAKKRGMHVILDLVAGHTSIDHPWFKASASVKQNCYWDWYIWTRDWTESAGEKFKEVNGFSERNGNFLCNFFWSQPALNYGFAQVDPEKPWQKSINDPACKAVRREMIKIMRYWLDMGAAGFRVDMASTLIKNDPEWKETSAFWQKVRAMFDKDYPEAALVAEWSNPAAAIAAGFHMDFLLGWGTGDYASLFRKEKGADCWYATEGESYFRKKGKGDATHFFESYLTHYEACKGKGYVSIPSGNHDVPRVRWGRTLKELEVVFAFLMTLPGVPVIYYGDEIGMQYQHKLPNKEGGYTRTGSRTPMQWNDKKNAGFSTAKASELYLPVDNTKTRSTVAKQDDKANSLLNTVRGLVTLRRECTELCGNGEFEILYLEKGTYPLVYQRGSGRNRFVVAINPAGRDVKATFDMDDPVDLTMVSGSGKVAMGIGRHHTARGVMKKQLVTVHLSMSGVSYGIFRVREGNAQPVMV